MRTSKHAFSMLLVATAIAGAVVACSPGPQPVTIGPEGGTATAADGARVVVPAGALTANVPVAIAPIASGAPDLPPGVESAGTVYALTPHGTTFAKPVTVSVPVEPGLVAAAELLDGPGPSLLKTNAAGDWFALSGASIADGEGGAMLSAETTSFSFLTTATGQRRVNADGLFRSWYFWGIPRDGNDITLVVPPPDEPAEGEVSVAYRFGQPPAGFGDGFADAEIYSSADGHTYWVYAEGPGDEPPDRYTGNEVLYAQAQSFRKEAGDATLKFTITAVRLEGKNYGGTDILPYVCVGSPACDLKLFGKIDFKATVWTAGENPRTLLNTGGHVVLKAQVPQLDPGQPFWSVSSGTLSSAPLWSLANGDFDFEVDSRDGYIALKQPITVAVDLTEVAVGELVTIEFRVEVETLNQVQGETYVAGFFRDPLSLEGAALEYSGLTPVAELQLRPEDDEAEACTTAIDPAAGTLQFEEGSYELLELPVGVSYAVVTREGGSSGDVSVRLRSYDDTALEGEDYFAVDQVVYFADGDDAPRWVEVQLVVDDVIEPLESLTLHLDDPRGCAGLGAPAVATIDIYDNDTPVDPNAGTYSVGGTVSGLVGSGLLLGGFGDHEVTVNANGPFVFDQSWASGVPYDVEVVQQPSNPGQVCSVSNGSGVLQDADITDVFVICAPPGASNPYLDQTFGDGGKLSRTLGLGANVVDVLAQSDGKVLVLDERALSRFTASGAPDTTFGSGGSVPVGFLGTSYDRAHAMAVQSDGKIVVVGESQVSVNDDNGHDWAIARYLATGSLDPSFGSSGSGVIVGDLGSTPGSPYHETLTDVAVQTDGTLVVGGYVNRFNIGSDFLVMRLTAAGQLDTAFGSGGVGEGVDIAGSSDIGEALALDGDGRILLAGRVAPSGGSDPDIGILRYLPNGDLDATFGDQGVLRDTTDVGDHPFDLLALDDGKVLAAGLLNRLPADGGAIGLLALYTAEGEPDSGFGANGRVLVEGLWSVDHLTRQADGQYLIVGSAVTGGVGVGDFVLARLGADGARDASFGEAGLVAVDFYGGIDAADVVALQDDGKILVAGKVTNGSTTELGLMRVMP